MKDKFNELYKYLDARFDEIKTDTAAGFKEVNRRIDILTNHVDRKNDDQDDVLDDHELRISTLESDYRILTHNLLA